MLEITKGREHEHRMETATDCGREIFQFQLRSDVHLIPFAPGALYSDLGDVIHAQEPQKFMRSSFRIFS